MCIRTLQIRRLLKDGNDAIYDVIYVLYVKKKCFRLKTYLASN